MGSAGRIGLDAWTCFSGYIFFALQGCIVEACVVFASFRFCITEFLVSRVACGKSGGHKTATQIRWVHGAFVDRQLDWLGL